MKQIYQIKKVFILLIFFTVVCGCKFSEYNIYGTYVYNRQENIKDTLVIMDNMTYCQKIYDLNDSLLFKHTETYRFVKGKRVRFQNLYPNTDRRVSNYYADCNSILITSSLPLKKRNGDYYFITNFDLGNYYYQVN